MISLDTKLAILQQTEYEWPRYEAWLAANEQSSIVVSPKKWTTKLKLLKALSPLLSLRGALWLLKVPQDLITWSLVTCAKVKLRYLQSTGLIVVAIAGSYAKTSTKYIATHLLSGSKHVVMTPENINTPIGIARFILGKMTGKEQVFIAELGEYYPGDIADLVRFLSPVYKILTPVGYAHLERFGSEEALSKGLHELVTTQPTRGKSFVYGKDYEARQLSNVSVSRAGTEFEYQSNHYFMPLFGAHNAVNSLPGLWLAHELGVPTQTVQAALASVSYVPHRLEPTQLEHGILLLDNGYNSNPASARESLAVLQALDAPQKIVSTPGFVELGPTQAAENETLGKEIAAIADLCIVIKSVNARAIINGLRAGGFHEAQIILAQNEAEGMNVVSKFTKPNAIILFENSVPELYK